MANCLSSRQDLSRRPYPKGAFTYCWGKKEEMVKLCRRVEVIGFMGGFTKRRVESRK
ncbi:unnamed protein product [Chondrus crispus]|uniref:Uncharacterized protein n=1 Tax=Chondrus crispus TaxID=2769 RepID=R7QNG0_CHOCR|nr:unnamed protein product [Chondrus crispus]CDF38991.1 unnamed protein product [Chondrus crispus]|eukprot:XP_005718896.1 unnamed protein product [Chondrus crispus]